MFKDERGDSEILDRKQWKGRKKKTPTLLGDPRLKTLISVKILPLCKEEEEVTGSSGIQYEESRNQPHREKMERENIQRSCMQ